MAKRVYHLFNEGTKSDRELLGGKGPTCNEMTNFGPAGALRLHHHHPDLPGSSSGGQQAARPAGTNTGVATDIVEKNGRTSAIGQSAVVFCALRRGGVDTGHDEHHSQHGPERRDS